MYIDMQQYFYDVVNFIGEHQQAWEDCCRYFHVDPDDEEALDNIDPAELEDWVWEHPQLYSDLEARLYKKIHKENKDALGDDYELYGGYLESLSVGDALREAYRLDEVAMPPIRKVLQDNKIMDTLDKDPQGTINKALQVVRDSDEISAKDKNTFANAVGKGPLNKKVSSLASYFYDVNRVGRRR